MSADTIVPKQFRIDIEEGQRLRGWITNSYAQIEFMLGDFILRCAQFAEYAEHTKTLPHGAPDRVKRVRAIVNKNGPAARFSNELKQILDQFEARHETRNLLAHGFCEYLYTPDGDAALQFQKWHRQPSRNDARLIRQFRLSEMQTEMESFSKMAQDAMVLFQKIHTHFGWAARPDA